MNHQNRKVPLRQKSVQLFFGTKVCAVGWCNRHRQEGELYITCARCWRLLDKDLKRGILAAYQPQKSRDEQSQIYLDRLHEALQYLNSLPLHERYADTRPKYGG